MDWTSLVIPIERLKLSFLNAGLEPPTEMVLPYETYWQIIATVNPRNMVSDGALALKGMMVINGVRIRPEPWKSEDVA